MAITSKILRTRGIEQAASLDIAAERVPPGQYLTSRFPVLTYGPNPVFDLSAWSLRIWGEVQAPLTLTWGELMAMEQVEQTCDIHCVTRWSKLDTTWRGVRARDVLARAAPTPAGRFVMAHCDGDYTTNLPLEALLDDDVLLAHTYDGHAAGARSRRAAAAARAQALLLEVREVPARPGGHDRRTGRASGSSTATTTTRIPGRSSAPGSRCRAMVARHARPHDDRWPRVSRAGRGGDGPGGGRPRPRERSAWRNRGSLRTSHWLLLAHRRRSRRT